MPVIKPIWLLVIQAVLVFFQLVNAQLAVMQDVPAWVTLIVSAGVGTLTFIVQHIGNSQVPAPKTEPTATVNAPKP